MSEEEEGEGGKEEEDWHVTSHLVCPKQVLVQVKEEMDAL